MDSRLFDVLGPLAMTTDAYRPAWTVVVGDDDGDGDDGDVDGASDETNALQVVLYRVVAVATVDADAWSLIGYEIDGAMLLKLLLAQ